MARIFKKAPRRLVASLDTTTRDGRRLVIKAFPLRHLLVQLRWRRYGYREFRNHREAQCRGIPTPELYAYFQVKDRVGLTKNCGVLIEHLPGYVTLREALERDSINRRRHLADAAGLLRLCRAAGANHIDLSVDNIMLGPAGFKIIDWQYASFPKAKEDAQTVMQTAYFLQTAPFATGSPEGAFFKREVHAGACPHLNRERFDGLVDQLADSPRVSTAGRATLNVRALKALDRK